MDISSAGSSQGSSAYSPRPPKNVDAFILYNERERDFVGKIVEELEASYKISTQFFDRDVPFGSSTTEIAELQNAKTIVVFIGQSGWGPTQFSLASQAIGLKKDIIPVVLGPPPDGALDQFDGMFRSLRYVNLGGADTVEDLAERIKNGPQGRTRNKAERRQSSERAAASVAKLIDDFLKRQSPSITEVTPVARMIIAKSVVINPSEAGNAQITTTRLLIAISDVGASIADKASDGDRFGAVAVSHVLNSDDRFSEFGRLRARYVNEQSTNDGVRGIGASENVRSILAAATRNGTLAADSLVAALLAQPDTNMEMRLGNAGINMADLRAAVLTSVLQLDASRADYWRSLLSPVEPGAPADLAVIYAQMGNDNPDSANLDDKLGVADEARAFARVAAARQVEPPLAFGIFGNWGSGKSFFMRLMQEYVDKLANKKVEEAQSDLFHDKIVQIRFNAWHYTETSLWASLVDHIFSEFDRWISKKLNQTEQDKLFDKLTTARELTLDSAEKLVDRRREQKAAVERVSAAEHALAAANLEAAGSPQLLWTAFRNGLLDTQKAEIDEAMQTLGLQELAANSELLKNTLGSLTTESRRANIVTRGIWRTSLRPSRVLAVVAAVVLVPTGLTWLLSVLQDPAHPQLSAIFQHINAAGLAAAGVIGSIALWLGAIGRHVTSAVAAVESFRLQLDHAVASRTVPQSDEVKKAEESLAKLNANVAEARALLATTTEHLTTAARDYAGETGRGRLLRFVRERVALGEYAKHLGLIATVRRDFTDLSAMMASVDPSVQKEAERRADAYKIRVTSLIGAADKDKLLNDEEKKQLEQSIKHASPTSQPIFQRIILYIDDLDRCPPETVVEVLQAVHLLLTFPLFIVVVAVDARWVSRSLESKYTHLIGDTELSAPGASATPRDYIEKIFQVPYWVRPMTAQGSRNLLKARASAPIAESISPGASSGGSPDQQPSEIRNALPPGPQPLGNPAAVDAQVTPRPAAPPNNPQNPIATIDPAAAPAATVAPEVAATAKRTAKIAARALELTAAEQAFMDHIAPFAGSTPRRALRFLNVYRIIKASLGADELSKLETNAGYRGLMSQLAVTTGAPSLQKWWTNLLNSGGSKEENAATIRKRLKSEPWYSTSPEARCLEEIIAAFWAEPQTSEVDLKEDRAAVALVRLHGIEELRHYSEIATRYCFGV
jgi:hypothetical protein